MKKKKIIEIPKKPDGQLITEGEDLETDREFKQIQHICCNQEMKSLCDNKDVMIDLFTCQICGQKMESHDKGNKRDGNF